MEKSKIIAIIGLGNIGKEYENTRHNAGFMFVDKLQQSWNLPEWKEDKKMKSLVTSGTYEDQKIILVKPTTFMNLSGETVSAVVNFYKISPENLWVVYDDLDLPLGKIRIRTDGSAGTHNGMKSTLQHLPTTTFPRIRIGIESRGEVSGLPEAMDTSDFVLGKFTSKERSLIESALQNGEKAIVLALKEGTSSAMNSYN